MLGAMLLLFYIILLVSFPFFLTGRWGLTASAAEPPEVVHSQKRMFYFSLPMKQFSLSEQLPQMIYVTSQEGLPGFLFHLFKKSTLLEFYQEAQIKLTGTFCFVLGRLLLESCSTFKHWEKKA